MSQTYIPQPLRNLVKERANFHCEYCLVHEAYIRPLTPIGRATVHLLGLNDFDRLQSRENLVMVGRYP